jgi:HEAT repeat protein
MSVSLAFVILAVLACGKRIDTPSVPELIEQLNSSDQNAKIRALHGLLEHGPAAEPAIPVLQALIEGSSQGNVRLLAYDVLNEIGGAALPAYKEMLRHADSEIRSLSVMSIGGMANRRPETFDEVITILNDAALGSDERLRRSALHSFAHMKRDHNLSRAVSAIVPFLLEENETTRSTAANLLGFDVGAEAKGAVPQLIEYLGNDRDEVRWVTAWVLGMIGPEAREAVPALRKLLEDPSQSVRDHAAAALEKIEGPSVPN